MRLAELTAYAEKTYHVEEQRKWTDFPGFSVLCHPQTGKWVALLMRQWDTETGTEREHCDLKCGSDCLRQLRKPYLLPPLRMRGSQWIGIRFDDRTEPETVFRLFDQAIASGQPQGFLITLDSLHSSEEGGYRDSPIRFEAEGARKKKQSNPARIEIKLPDPDGLRRMARQVLGGLVKSGMDLLSEEFREDQEKVPERLRQLRRMFAFGGQSTYDRAKQFYRQAVFMADYEDDARWHGDFIRYFPSYQDMNLQQLRGYFGWRSRVRKGIYQPIPLSAAYLYLYELLNGIGTASPEDSLEKLRAFEAGFLDAGFGDAGMRANLQRWMLEFAVLRDLPPELARQVAPPAFLEQDAALSALRKPETHSDEEIFAALCRWGGKKLEGSPVVTKNPERGIRLFSQAWQAASAYRQGGIELFRLCFGASQSRRWYPLSNAVFYDPARPRDRSYALTDCSSYHCRGGVWQKESYEKLFFDKSRLQGFLHETDARLRRYLKTGRYLREKPEDEWAIPYIDGVIAADRQAQSEAARAKLTIDLSGLAQIRADAAVTRENLLTEEEREPEGPLPEAAVPPAAETGTGLLPEYRQILLALLQGGDGSGLMRDNHLMPSMVADAVNEAFYDEIGDTVLLCEGDALALVEDYIEDVRHLLEGE